MPILGDSEGDASKSIGYRQGGELDGVGSISRSDHVRNRSPYPLAVVGTASAATTRGLRAKTLCIAKLGGSRDLPHPLRGRPSPHHRSVKRRIAVDESKRMAAGELSRPCATYD